MSWEKSTQRIGRAVGVPGDVTAAVGTVTGLRLSSVNQRSSDLQRAIREKKPEGKSLHLQHVLDALRVR